MPLPHPARAEAPVEGAPVGLDQAQGQQATPSLAQITVALAASCGRGGEYAATCCRASHTASAIMQASAAGSLPHRRESSAGDNMSEMLLVPDVEIRGR